LLLNSGVISSKKLLVTLSSQFSPKEQNVLFSMVLIFPTITHHTLMSLLTDFILHYKLFKGRSCVFVDPDCMVQELAGILCPLNLYQTRDWLAFD
jgi:hypothetical protein